MSVAKADISIVLNLHDETRYLRRTMRSLEEAVGFARLDKLSFELVAVLDRPSPSLAQWVAAYDFSAFDLHRVIEVDYGSPGPSRNSGARVATGTYIATCDADDLISYNCFRQCYCAIRQAGPGTIVVPQYVLGFGESYHLYRCFGTETVSRLAFFGDHPYTARIFAHRSVFETIEYPHIREGDGFAYEDWHFNCEAVAKGYEFAVAKDTILFYRQRAHSHFRQEQSISTRLIPMSSYFLPGTFLERCAGDFQRFVSGDIPGVDPAEIRREFRSNHVCLETMYAANRIDPAVDAGFLPDIAIGSNLGCPPAPGAAYFRICRRVGDERFTDVFIVPFQTTGGAEKYILDVMNGLCQLDPKRRILMLAGERIASHAWLDRLPRGTVFVDLQEACPGCGDDVLDVITLRLIQSAAPGAHVHVRDSVYGLRFFRKYGGLLRANRKVLYRFCETTLFQDGLRLERGFMFNFLSEFGEMFDLVITDNERIVRRDRTAFDVLTERWHTLYARCSPTVSVETVRGRQEPSHRLLWASRLDDQKRPAFLLSLAPKLRQSLPQVKLEIWGAQVLNAFDVRRFEEFDNLVYRGPFSDFSSLQPENYDALVYTTQFDGMPNVVLEAMAAGLPVIAPDVGGVSEAVKTGETGILLENILDDSALAEAYVRAIASIYQDNAYRVALGVGAVDRSARQHAEEAYLARLAQIFGLPAEAPATPALPLARGSSIAVAALGGGE